MGPGQYPAALPACRAKPSCGKASKVGGWTETRPVSLGLLPSGPDPVGEWCVHCQPPSTYLDRPGEFRNRLKCSNQAAAGKSAARPHGIRRGKDTAILFSPARGIGRTDHSATRLARKSSSRRLHADAWSLDGSAILAEAAFSVAKDHIHHPGQTVFHRRRVADERPKRARQQRQLHKLKTLFPLDLVAGFAQRRLTGTNN